MSPREKHLALLSALGFFTLAFYYIPTFLYVTLIFIICCSACYYHSGGSLFTAGLGPNPRARLNFRAGLCRWLAAWGVTGFEARAPGRTRSRNRVEAQQAEVQSRDRGGESRVYRREVLASDSFLFSPRDLLMGSYIGKPESPPAATARPRAARNPREQLREKLARPNHAVYTPNRRLSFSGDPLGSMGKFTIAPKRHYPLQQPGLSSVGVLPPVRWDGFKQKNVLSPHNSAVALSPVTVRIARRDPASPRLGHLSPSGITKTPDDPCSRESVLRVLKESRKREVEDEDKSFTAEQKSKRRRNDSGGSAQSAFEPLVPNGALSQLVPKPGTLKRGLTSMVEDSTVKRSRASSVSSVTGGSASKRSTVTKRNAIQSSYSSSYGLNQWKRPSAASSPLSSPGSSRSQTPEIASKKPREEEAQFSSPGSSVKSAMASPDKVPVTLNATPVTNIPVTTSSSSAGSGGKRKRKIQLVSSNRDDQISLPPPPELGYTLTAKDLDEEKRAAISKIQKVLETPAPVVEKPAAAVVTTSSQSFAAITTKTPTLSSLLAAPLPETSSSNVPVINLDPSPATSGAATAASPTSLLEVLKMKIPTPTASSTTASESTVQSQTLTLKTSVLPSTAPSQPSSSAPSQSSAFTQVLTQITKPTTNTPASTAVAPTLFNLTSPITVPAAPSPSIAVSSAAATTSTSSTSNPPLTTGFKPIFAAAPSVAPTTTSSEIKPPVQTFTAPPPAYPNPPSLTATSSLLTPSSSSSVFGATTSGATSAFSSFGATPLTTSVATTQPAGQTAIKSLFGGWSAPPTATSTAASNPPMGTGSTLTFGATTTTSAAVSSAPAPATSTTSSQGGFTFGMTKTDPQLAGQNLFGFGQTAPNPSTVPSFGGFAMAGSAPTTTAAAAASSTSSTQPTFAFGKPAFEVPTTQPSFGSSAAAPKSFTFGSAAPPAPVTNPAPAPAPAPAPFTFGAAAASTTAATFGTPAKPTFGGSSTGFAFGSAPPAQPAPLNFGAATQSQSSTTNTTFTFGAVAPQPAPTGPVPQPTGGFNFGTAMAAPQFGGQASNSTAPQMGGFNFGSAAADKNTFGTPTFGQTSTTTPIPFGSPGTPGFHPAPFGSPATPTFSIGAGSKPTGARQRLQARRQHNRKK